MMNRTIIALLFLLKVSVSFGQVDIIQLNPDSQRYMVPVTDSLIAGEWWQRYLKLADPHLYLKDDSICYTLFDGRDTACIPSSFTAIFGNGDSTRIVGIGDSLFINYPEPGAGGGGDSTYYWILQVNSANTDTITDGELVNFIAGTGITIGKSASNITISTNADTDVDSVKLIGLTLHIYEDDKDRQVDLSPLIDTAAADTCLQSLLVLDLYTFGITYCNSNVIKDTIRVNPASIFDRRLDSIGVINAGDSIPFFMVDSSGNSYDTLWAVVPSDSIDTDSQSLLIDTTTSLFTLSRDPTATPDLLVLPWKDAIRDDYSANYMDSIRHQGNVGVNVIPVHPIDVLSSDPFNTIQGRFKNPFSGVASLRLERGGDGVYFDLMNWGASFDLRRMDVGGSGDQFMRLDTTATGRLQHYIWHDNEGFLWATDYGKGYHIPTDPEDSIQYLLAPRADGRFLEVSFMDILDSLVANGIGDSITGDADWYVWSTTNVPTDITQNIFTNGKAYVGSGTNNSVYQFQVLLNGNNYAFRTSTDQNYSEWMHEVKDELSNDIRWYHGLQSNLSRRDYRITYSETDTAGVYFVMKEGYNSILRPAITIKKDGDLILGQYIEGRLDGTADDITGLMYVKNDTLGGESGGVLQIATIDTLKRVLSDWDFVMLEDGDTSYYQSQERDSLLPLYEHTLDSLIWRPGVVRLGDTTFVKRTYSESVEPNLSFFEQYPPQLQIVDRVNATEAHGSSFVYDWRSVTKGDWSFRLHDQGQGTDSIPHYYEIGVSSYHPTSETEADTTYRQVLRISSHANENAFVLHQDSIILGDYDPATDIDSAIGAADIEAIYVPQAGGVMKLALLDTLNAALNTAVSTPNITLFDRYNAGDSVALNLNATGDTAFADLSWLRNVVTADVLYQGLDSIYDFGFKDVSISGDSLFQGGVYVGMTGSPAGSDRNIQFNNAGDFGADTTFVWSSSRRLGVGTLSPGSKVHVHEPSASSSLIRFTNNTTGSTASDGLIVGYSSGFSTIFNYEAEPIIFSTNTSARMRLHGSSPNLMIGTGSFNATERLQLYNSSAGGSSAALYTNGTTGVAATDGLYVGYSDKAKVWNYEKTELIFGTDNNERLGIKTNGQLRFNSYTASTSNNGISVGLLGYNSSGEVLGVPPNLVASFVTGWLDNYQFWTVTGNSGSTQVDATENVTIQGVGLVSTTVSGANLVQVTTSADNYSNWTAGAQTGTAENVSSGETIYWYGEDGDIVTRIGTGDVYFSIPINAINTAEIADLQITTAKIADLNVTGAKLETLGSSGSCLNCNISVDTKGRVTAFSNGSSGGGGGIYGTNGNVGGGVQSVTATIGSDYSLNFRHNALNKVIIGSSVIIRNISGGSVDIGDALNTWKFSYNSFSSYMRMYNAAAGSGSYFGISNGGTIFIQGNGSTQITSPIVSISASTGLLSMVAVTDITLNAGVGRNVEIEDLVVNNSTISGTATVILKSSGGSLSLQGQDGNSSISLSSNVFIAANQPSSDITLSTSGGDDIALTSGDDITMQGDILTLTFPSEVRTSTGTQLWMGFVGDQSANAILEVSGDAYKNSGTDSWLVPSDRRIKERIQDLEDPYDVILKLHPISYYHIQSYRDTFGLPEKQHFGYIADEFEQVFPGAISEGPEFFEGEERLKIMSSSDTQPYTVAAVQQLIKDKERLEAKVNQLEQDLRTTIALMKKWKDEDKK